MKDEKLLAAFQGWEELSMNDKEFAAYEGRMKKILDEQSAIRAAELREEQAEKRGLERGEWKTKKAMARRLLKMDYSIDDIVLIVDLTQEQVLELKRELD